MTIDVQVTVCDALLWHKYGCIFKLCASGWLYAQAWSFDWCAGSRLAMPFYGISTVVSLSYVQVVGCTFRPVVDVQVTVCNALLWYKYYVQIAVVMYLSFCLWAICWFTNFCPGSGHLLPWTFTNIPWSLAICCLYYSWTFTSYFFAARSWVYSSGYFRSPYCVLLRSLDTLIRRPLTAWFSFFLKITSKW